MQKLKLCAAVSMATLMLSQSALADRVKGSAKANFSNDELEVPCVLIEGTDGNGDGRFKILCWKGAASRLIMK